MEFETSISKLSTRNTHSQSQEHNCTCITDVWKMTSYKIGQIIKMQFINYSTRVYI